MTDVRARRDGIAARRVLALWPAARFGLAALGCVAVTAVATPLRGVLEPASVVMLFLLVVFCAALWLGRDPAVAGAFLSVGLFDFFFVPPRLTFAVANVGSVVTFGVMLAVGLITADLTARLRRQIEIANARARENHVLYGLARRLAAASSVEQVGAALNAYLEPLGCEAEFHLLDARGEFGSLKGHPAALRLALTALRLNEPVDTALNEPEVGHAFIPLRAPMRALGIVALRLQAGRSSPLPEGRERLQTGAALAAFALERLMARRSPA